MSENEDQGDPTNMGDLTGGVEYEDDFEKDLEWLINEEEEDDDEEEENLDEREVFVKLNAKLYASYLEYKVE